MDQKVASQYVVYQDSLVLKTRGNGQITDITDKLQGLVRKSGIQKGVLHIFCPGSTGAITTLEYERGLIEDMRNFLQKWAPREYSYQHNLSHGDGNGHSHVQASLIGPSLSVPVKDGHLNTGTWQQVVFIDCDNRSRSRELTVTIMGV